jgi:hypothetical protein
MMPAEIKFAAERFPRRRDTGYRAVRPLAPHSLEYFEPSNTSGAPDDVSPPRDASLVRKVAVIDPDGAYDATSRFDRHFEFDRVFDDVASNGTVYGVTVAPLVAAVRRGVNATCFAYGMTGAGKTFTMSGDERQGIRGICSLAAQDLFDDTLMGVVTQHSPVEQHQPQHAHQAGKGTPTVIQTLHVSYLEIYNERIRDLLVEPAATGPAAAARPGTNRNGNASSGPIPTLAPRLDVIEDAERGVVVTNLTEILVTSVEQLEILMSEGAARRVMASTGSNQASSRSHAVLQITVRRHTGANSVLTGRLQLIDLAGSERAVARGGGASLYHQLYGYDTIGGGSFNGAAAAESARQSKIRNEGANINRSLLALGACITALGAAQSSTAGSNATSSHVPYRDSKLTRLLKESLGGNTRTAMIAAVSPSCLCYEETLSTLKYASKARSITRTVRRNTVEATDAAVAHDYRQLIRALEHDVAGLRAQVQVNQSAIEPPLLSAFASPARHQHASQSPDSKSPATPGQSSRARGGSVPGSVEISAAAARVRLADLKAQFAVLERQQSPAHDGSASLPRWARSAFATGTSHRPTYTAPSGATSLQPTSRETSPHTAALLDQWNDTLARREASAANAAVSPHGSTAETDRRPQRQQVQPQLEPSVEQRRRQLDLLKSKLATQAETQRWAKGVIQGAAYDAAASTAVLGARDFNAVTRTAKSLFVQRDTDRPWTSSTSQQSEPTAHSATALYSTRFENRGTYVSPDALAKQQQQNHHEVLRRLIATRYADAFV